MLGSLRWKKSPRCSCRISRLVYRIRCTRDVVADLDLDPRGWQQALRRAHLIVAIDIERSWARDDRDASWQDVALVIFYQLLILSAEEQTC